MTGFGYRKHQSSHLNNPGSQQADPQQPVPVRHCSFCEAGLAAGTSRSEHYRTCYVRLDYKQAVKDQAAAKWARFDAQKSEFGNMPFHGFSYKEGCHT